MGHAEPGGEGLVKEKSKAGRKYHSSHWSRKFGLS